MSANPVEKSVFRTPEEKWIANCIKLPGYVNEIGLIVWWCFKSPNQGRSVPILEGEVDCWVYIALLDGHLPSNIEEIG